MKILIINRSESGGGAFVAGFRHFLALRHVGANVTMLVLKKKTDEKRIIAFSHNAIKHFFSGIKNIIEQIFYRILIKNKNEHSLFTIDVFGNDISKLSILKEADIIHIHWINLGFLSIRDLRKIIQLGKPIVFTLHDMWLFTGGCHHADDCSHFEMHCGFCPQLRCSCKNDISAIRHKHKQEILKAESVSAVVACSNWIEGLARNSSILRSKHILTIPNAIDLEIYKPDNTIKKVKRILFIATNVGDERKGFKYFKQCMQILSRSRDNNDLEIKVLGKYKPEYFLDIPFRIDAIGSIYDQKEIAHYYAESAILIMPSLMENLPNTIMESMACGTPVVAFNVGGIPDLIDHKHNGYLAKYESADDLAFGVQWIMDHYEITSTNARKKAVREYSYDVIAQKHLELYHNLTETH